MKTKLSIAIAALLLSTTGSVVAAPVSNMSINVGSNGYEFATAPFATANDANFTTALFSEFGFTQILATSVYDISDGSILGSFYDTNIASELTAAGVPASGLAMDGLTTVNLAMPAANGSQTNIDALSPIVPPLNTTPDSEGYDATWDLKVLYHFDGTLDGTTGPSFTGGYFDLYFDDYLNNANDRKVIRASVTGSTITAANLDIFFNITFAETGFLFINGIDVASLIASGDFATLHLDTNVNPPIPAANQLLVVGTNAIRQTTLDGSISGNVPEPASLALLGMGLLGFGASRRRKQA